MSFITLIFFYTFCSGRYKISVYEKNKKIFFFIGILLVLVFFVLLIVLVVSIGQTDDQLIKTKCVLY